MKEQLKKLRFQINSRYQAIIVIFRLFLLKLSYPAQNCVSKSAKTTFVSQFGESSGIRPFLAVFTQVKSFSVVTHFIVEETAFLTQFKVRNKTNNFLFIFT